jgi:nitrous oxidase accessory protein NosD
MLLLAPMAESEPKTVTVPADYPTIKAAVEASAPGDTVLIRPGQFQESLVLDKAITIKGEAPEQVLIHNSVLVGEIIKITSKETVRLENLILEHTDKEPDQNKPKYPDLVKVDGGGAELRRCVLRKGAGCGLAITKGGVALAENCRMENNTQTGVIIRGENARGRLVNNALEENAWGGVMVFDGGTGEFIDNTVVKNGRNGIFIYGPGPESVIIRGNRIEGSPYAGIEIEQRKRVMVESNTVSRSNTGGIRVQNGAEAEAKLNTCEENAVAGILAAGVLTRALIEDNTCSKNKGPGVLVYAAAQARIVKNKAIENRANGITVRMWDTSAEIKSNTCDKNTANGILVAMGATATVADNSCSENGGRGVVAVDEGTSATIGTNAGEENRDATPLADTPVVRQGQVDEYFVGWALAAGQFDYLEGLVARLRGGKCRDMQGHWELNHFYDGLSEGYYDQTWKKKGLFMARVTEWGNQKPQSVAARILLAKTYVNYAWEARGNGYAKEVTAEGFKGFKEKLTEAEKALNEAEAMTEKDPELYGLWLYAGMGLNYKRDRMDALLEKGIALAPDYYPMYSNMAFNLTSRWHGKGRDLENFFKKARDASKGTCGDTLYALLVSDYMNEFNCIYVGSGEMADWNGINSGFEQLVADFPTSSYYLNKHCLMACMFQKRDLAAELFKKIGDKADPNVWGEKEDSKYREYHRWATMDDQPFPCQDERSTPFNVSSTQMKRYLMIGSAVLIGLSLIATLIIVIVFGGRAMQAKR